MCMGDVDNKKQNKKTTYAANRIIHISVQNRKILCNWPANILRFRASYNHAILPLPYTSVNTDLKESP